MSNKANVKPAGSGGTGVPHVSRACPTHDGSTHCRRREPSCGCPAVSCRSWRVPPLRPMLCATSARPISPPGYSAAWLARLTGGQKVGGSNPPTPIQGNLHQQRARGHLSRVSWSRRLAWRCDRPDTSAWQRLRQSHGARHQALRSCGARVSSWWSILPNAL